MGIGLRVAVSFVLRIHEKRLIAVRVQLLSFEGKRFSKCNIFCRIVEFRSRVTWNSKRIVAGLEEKEAAILKATLIRAVRQAFTST